MGAEAEGAAEAGELARRAARAQAAAAALAGAGPGGLRAPPLASLDYDHFPLQEDALAVINCSV